MFFLIIFYKYYIYIFLSYIFEINKLIICILYNRYYLRLIYLKNHIYYYLYIIINLVKNSTVIGGKNLHFFQFL